jgi:protease secretion system outer membrane protein
MKKVFRHWHAFFLKLFLSLALSFNFYLPPLQANEMDLNRIFSLAKNYDAKYKTAEVDKTLNKYQADIAYSAFAPNLNYNYTDYSNKPNSTQNTLSITQPIFSIQKFEQLSTGAPKSSLADALLMAQEQDLASRVYVAVSNLITQNQAIESNKVRVNTLQKQLDRSARLIELGYGTITDQRDIKVRYEQAVANGVQLEINRRNAIIQIMSLTNNSVDTKEFTLPESHNLKGAFELNALLAKVEASNPSLIAARNTEKISSLEAKRQRDQLLPELSVTQSKRWGDTYNDNLTMFNVTMPIDATRVIQGLSSSANEEKAIEVRRQTELQLRMLTSQLYESVMLGKEALESKKNAVEAAKLSVDANERSSVAGVRTTIEVLNSIDTLYQSRNDYASTAVNLGNSLLNLLLISGSPPEEAIAQTQTFLFGK